MSFADLESGTSRTSNSSSATPQSPQDAAFLGLNSSLSLQAFKINQNVQGILRQVDKLGTSSDTGAIRKELHDLVETTRQMAKKGTDDLKKLAVAQANLPHQKGALEKTSHDFQMSLLAFQRAQQFSAEKQRTVVEGVKIAVDEEQNRTTETLASSPEQRQAQVFQQRLSPSELAHQESLIQEREREIREIETGIHELHEIFRDLGTLVNEQGGMLENIEANISNVAVDTQAASEELTQAHVYQKKAGRRAACLMMIVVVVVCVVLLAILS